MRAVAATEVRPANGPLSGGVRVPGDKSISHRMALLAAIASGRSKLSGFSDAGDCAATLNLLRSLGVHVSQEGDAVVIDGGEGLSTPEHPVDCRRSGTTMRLACGVLAGSQLDVTLTGDAQLLRRPMERVAEPLRRMGARIDTTDGLPPVRLHGGSLAGIDYELPVASAQVKSAVLLAGLRARDVTTVVEPIPTRDHTERLLAWLGAPIEIEGSPRRISIRAAALQAFEASVPGDVSSAAPLLAAAALVPGSSVAVGHVGLNPTRTGFVDLLERMGARVEREASTGRDPEPLGILTVRHAELRAVEISAEEIPNLIDELPLVGVLGAFAEGTTVVRGAAELRVKESDRISGLIAGLRSLGAEAEELPDGFAVTGPTDLEAASVDSAGDHRLAMAFAVAALVANGPLSIEGLDSVADSFPGFVETLELLR
jgi:3-phosphoshikimate 1-carboxyvinyltransferase